MLQVLSDLNIQYQQMTHPPVHTVAEARQYDCPQPGDVQVKNLFLRNKQGNRHYLLVVEEDRDVDFRELALLLGEAGLGLASAERLMRFLGTVPGAVGVFGLLNDGAHQVVVLLAERLTTAARIGFHPNIRTATVWISGENLDKFLRWTENRQILLKG